MCVGSSLLSTTSGSTSVWARITDPVVERILVSNVRKYSGDAQLINSMDQSKGRHEWRFAFAYRICQDFLSEVRSATLCNPAKIFSSRGWEDFGMFSGSQGKNKACLSFLGY
jgi:hypothetical protein